MTVRLRPRQVLCSKCKGICNENSENVSRKRKNSRAPSPVPITKRTTGGPVTRSSNSLESTRKRANLEEKVQRVQKQSQKKEREKKEHEEKEASQKVTRSNAQEIPNALSGNVNKLNIDNNSKRPFVLVTNLNTKCAMSLSSAIKLDSTHSLDHSEEIPDEEVEKVDTIKPEIVNKSIKRILRKKRSIGSMEDLWDEAFLEEKAKKDAANVIANSNLPGAETNVCSSTRTIKISYGPQGEGTVLKIPAQIENLVVSDDSEENMNVDDPKNKVVKDSSNKAARKALKKAKKEARKKVMLSGSPIYIAGNSPRYSGVSSTSPRYTIGSASPRHGLGNNSPRYLMTASLDANNTPRRRKHKMKHKKKHREDKERKHKDAEVKHFKYIKSKKKQKFSECIFLRSICYKYFHGTLYIIISFFYKDFYYFVNHLLYFNASCVVKIINQSIIREV